MGAGAEAVRAGREVAPGVPEGWVLAAVVEEGREEPGRDKEPQAALPLGEDKPGEPAACHLQLALLLLLLLHLLLH